MAFFLLQPLSDTERGRKEEPLTMAEKNESSRIPDKDSLITLFKEAGRPLSPGDIEAHFHLTKRDGRAVNHQIRLLLEEGALVRLRHNRLGLPKEMNLVTGALWATRSGNGFVIVEKEKPGDDIFIPARSMAGALNGDRVVVRVEHRQRGKREGKIIEVLSRKHRNMVGFIKKQGGLTYLVPEDEKIPYEFVVAKTKKDLPLDDGTLAAARITRFPEGRNLPECSVLTTFEHLEHIQDINRLITYKYDLPARFPRKVETETKALPSLPQAVEHVDLSAVHHVTIDGESARDFDDAVAVVKDRSGFTLYVSIAAVGSFVSPLTDLDREAFSRGTSIYLPGTVIPMLPRRLSNDLCSLNPLADRLTMTVQLGYDLSGRRTETSLYPSRIRSSGRLTYRDVEEALLGGNGKARGRLAAHLPHLEIMAELASLLISHREKEGTLDFDLPEPEILTDTGGTIQDIVRSTRLFSHRIIEEFMIAANHAVAEYCDRHSVPAIYRVHESPDAEKIRDVEQLIRYIPAGPKRGKRNFNKYLQSVLKTVHGTEYEFFVNRVLLRSMKQARYAAENRGHFGLALTSYLHFTSPIRRYPDLVCHRTLSASLSGQHPPVEEDKLESMAAHLSERERLAMDAEREIDERARILFMKEKIGEEFDGIVSHVTSFGIFVELVSIFVEGLVLLSDLADDYYIFQEEKLRVVGRRRKKTYTLGDRIRIRVIEADVEQRRLHLIPA